MERKLASLQKVESVEEIPGYDRIVQIKVLGWSLIAKKDEFKPGDLCVYFEVDSILPEHKIFEFMASKKYIVKTMKMAKTISQGLAVPTSFIKEINPKFNKKLVVDMDLTKVLGVEKYDPQTKAEMQPTKKDGRVLAYFKRFAWFRRVYFFLFGHKRPKGNFPKFIKKTDETNIQAVPRYLHWHANKPAYFTEKLEGQSATYALKKGDGVWGKRFHFYVCSHNVHYPHVVNNNFWNIAKSKGIEKILRDYHDVHGVEIAIQGEIVGPGIQQNIYKLNDLDFYVFNVFNINTGKYFSLSEMREFATETGLKLVPVVDGDVDLSRWTVDTLLAFSNGKSQLYNTAREGIVVRGLGQEFSFKVKSPVYLSKNQFS